ncbi:hypothetical protein SLEP1_g25188 [Rubroshorea leprosula]|uniref:PGG domain-containing protein n=1 Tax=Rubroshorea leprosula TaxID=152421 RepID=A0AAV5JL61_9ROSI|nr:hypothetical protein SLEP1_g25188 [Rubroshorea leprosula]
MDTSSVQPIPFTSSTVSLNAIIPEILKEDNYERWSILMQHYLVAQGLWNVVLSSQIPWAEDAGDWIKRNASALLAIKISCGAEMFDQIKNMNSAKDAWNALANLHKPPNVEERRGRETDAVKETMTGVMDNNERTEFVTLLKDIYTGDSNALKSLDKITGMIFPSGFTALHIATIAGHLKIVNELVKIMGEDYLEIQDDNGDTALSLAACNGEMKIAECLVQKNDKLLTIRNKEGYIPLVVACFNRMKDMSSYLYSVTPFEFLLPENSNQGALFLKYCVLNFMFDVGLDLFLRCPQLAASTRESITISELSAQPSLFPIRTRLHPYNRFLYKCLCFVKLPSPSEGMHRSIHKIFRIHVAWVKVIDGILELPFFIHRQFYGAARLKDIYKRKLTHMYVNSVLQHCCKEISTYRDARQLVESGTVSAIFQAIKDGTVEIVIEILKANPDLIWCNKMLSRDILISTIKYRQEGLLRFVYRLDAGKKAFLSLGDEDGNNVLHLVAKLPDLQGFGNFHPVWAMQQEEVKSVLPSPYEVARNLYGESPLEVFRREHQQLTNEASEWAKKTADSYILVPVLIVTIMFAAIFTVPGGNNQETGIPILLHRKLFSGFLICDVVSLLTGSTSMLAFLDILIKSRSDIYLRKSLPSNLMWAISSLVISIVTMILAFIFALTMMLQKKWEVLPAIIIYLLLFPITVLSLWLYPTLADFYNLMFRPIIFKRRSMYGIY